MPTIKGVLETVLRVSELQRSEQFFQSVFGFETLEREENFCALRVSAQQVLVLKKSGAYAQHVAVAGGMIPPAESAGQLHLAFAIPTHDLELWLERLTELGVPIESRINWKKGGATSIYVRDPDDNCIELMTPGVWDFYS